MVAMRHRQLSSIRWAANVTLQDLGSIGEFVSSIAVVLMATAPRLVGADGGVESGGSVVMLAMFDSAAVLFDSSVSDSRPKSGIQRTDPPPWRVLESSVS